MRRSTCVLSRSLYTVGTLIFSATCIMGCGTTAMAMPSTENPDAPLEQASPQETPAPPSPEELQQRTECLDRGGVWMNDVQMGFLKQKGCNESTRDKGKVCNDSSECESACINDDSSPTGGRCYGHQKFFGCGKRVKTGDHVSILCID